MSSPTKRNRPIRGRAYPQSRRDQPPRPPSTPLAPPPEEDIGTSPLFHGELMSSPMPSSDPIRMSSPTPGESPARGGRNPAASAAGGRLSAVRGAGIDSDMTGGE